LLFLLPLLVAYELGVLWLGGTQPDALRNGADTWMRWGPGGRSASTSSLSAPALILVVLLHLELAAARGTGPRTCLGVWIGMGHRKRRVLPWVCGASAAGWDRSLDRLGVRLGPGRGRSPCSGPRRPALLITFVGAGILRRGALSACCCCRDLSGCFGSRKLPGVLNLLSGHRGVRAGVLGRAPRPGPTAKRSTATSFCSARLAGLYFALLYQLRGFGIAVGAHACYDILVGVVAELG